MPQRTNARSIIILKDATLFNKLSMSYNYLPLDRKPINFQQVKNLLDFNQLLSVTFDAHERILHCRDYLDSKASGGDGLNEKVNASQFDLIKNNAYVYDVETPREVVKLMLMLKIKSLSYGHSGVDIETVKRLLEMYNNGVLPVVYRQNSDVEALSQLYKALTGSGEVYFKGGKRDTAALLKELNWLPFNFKNGEDSAIVSGTQFTAACGLYSLKKAEQLISMANVVAALSVYASGCSTEFLHEKLYSIRKYRGQAECAAVLRNYLRGADIDNRTKTRSLFLFSDVTAVHGAAMDAFEYVLNVFMTEANAVTESLVIFPDDDLILNNGNNNAQQLILALGFLSIAISSLGDSSQKRTAQLNSDLQLQAADIKGQVPGNTNEVHKCLQVIKNVEKTLAIELLSAIRSLEKQNLKSPPALEKIINAFRQSISTEKDNTLDSSLVEAERFIATYEVD